MCTLDLYLHLNYILIPMNKAVVLAFLLVLSLSSVNALAIEEAGVNLPDQKIYPRSFYYPVKRLLEKSWEKLKFSGQSKYDYYRSLLPTRLAELTYVVLQKQADQVQKSSERFAYQAGITTEKLKSLPDNPGEKQSLQNKLSEYSKVLEKLRDSYPANSSYWMLVQYSIDSLKLYSGDLKK